ncbi:MAG TPA: GTP-binding protein [Methanospirillum sp.]|uniref:GTP-binding protein n=1 Tax=Methanospirillum sp. TaxID=45200 RepID=UPI002CED1131|nr:GTP-binding protein [Methanospirillum sp.]HWQ64313.1 GTP-binding protein [Methanospirillum sp.]
MKLVTVAGPPSSGKTSVILHTIRELEKAGISVGVIKFDCISPGDEEIYQAAGVPIRIGLAGNLCPDHFFVSNIEECVSWGLKENLDLLITESAGLCNRCSPHIRGILGICVIDMLSGINTPKKIGPMLRLSDMIVITKGDIVSQAEREVFAFRVGRANPSAKIIKINGLTGQGVLPLADEMRNTPDTITVNDCSLRFAMPAALCSYCLGEIRIGRDYQMGNVKRMEF